MKKISRGFTLPELLVSVSISVILMLGIGVFVTSGLKNITLQMKVLNNSTNFSKIYTDISNLFLGDFNLSSYDSDNILIKNSYLYGGGNFSILSKRSFTGYCDDITANDYLVKKEFTPFEGIGGDIFGNGYVYDDGNVTVAYFTNEIRYGGNTFSGFFKNITGVHRVGSALYLADSSLQGIYKFNLLDFSSDPVLIIGKGGGVYGNNFSSGDLGIDIYLNNPTGIYKVGNNLFFSDSGNNRIMYLDLTNDKIYLFMDESDGLLNPTGLFYDSLNHDFYISNTGFGEVWEIKISTNYPTIPLGYHLNNTIYGVSNLGVSFNAGTINGFYSSGSFNLQNNTGYVYIYTGSLNSNSFSLDIQSTNFTGTGMFKVDSFSFSGDPGQYYANYDFGGQKTIKYSGFIIGDGNLLTKEDNLIYKYYGFSYPTGLYWDGIRVLVKDFLDRKIYNLNKNNYGVLNSFDFEDFIYEKSDYMIKDFIFSNISSFLNLKIEYYQNYDCNDSLKNISKTIIYKKEL